MTLTASQTYKIGTRTSPLALKQVEEVVKALREFSPSMIGEVVGLDTYGDRNKTIPISQIEGSDFFTREIDEALLTGKIDFAVHSAKDLPQESREGLVIAALTKSIDPYDVLVSESGLNLSELAFGSRVGTSSLRRKRDLKEFRPDFQIVNIRGNIEERLSLLDHQKTENLDGIVIAAAGLLRLGLENRITQRIPLDILKPHPLQGSLAIITRSQDSDLISLVSLLGSRETILA